MRNRIMTGTLLGVAAAWISSGWAVSTAATDEREYPIDVCIVSGMKLGSMGDPYVHEHGGREIRFCCGGCVGKFNADAANYLAKLDKMIIEKQKADYPLAVCVVSDEPLEDPVDVVYQNLLVRLCCKGCVADFESDPESYLKKLKQGTSAVVPEKDHGRGDGHGHHGNDHHHH